MLFLRTFGKSLLFLLVAMLGLLLIITLLNYIGLIGLKMLAFLKILIPILSFLVGGMVVGKRSTSKAWLEGIKSGLLIMIVLFIFNYLAFHNSFRIKHLLFYLILGISYIFGSMLGINLKKEK